MPLVLTEDETMLVDSARGVLARSSPVSAFRALRDGGDPLRYVPATWAELAENGFVAPHVPESDGGLGMGYAAAGLIAEQMGHVLAASPFLSSAMAAELLIRGGNEAQKSGMLPKLIDGSLIVGVAIDEGTRHAPDRIAARATPNSNAFAIDGTKRQVVDGAAAELLFVIAELDDAPALFSVDAKADGVTIAALDAIDSRNAADVTFAAAPAVLIGEPGDAVKAIASALDLGRVLVAAELLGMADELFDRTIAYLKEREQFGRKIGSFQALQHRAARLYARLDLARGVVLKALRALDEGDVEASMLVSLAKAIMAKTARDVSIEAVQMHGGIGVTDDVDIGLFFKRVRVAAELLGDEHYHGERLAREHWGL